jgi:hypothetical protein
MKKKKVLTRIIALSIIVGVYCLTKVFNLSNEFKDSFNEINTPSELKIDLETGVYDLFELSTKPNFEDGNNIDYLISENGENPKIIEIQLDTADISDLNKSSITYSIYDKKFKSIGQFEIIEKQSVKIISTINDKRIDKLAYRTQEQNNDVWVIMTFSLILLLSMGVFIVSAILLVINRNKKLKPSS